VQFNLEDVARTNALGRHNRLPFRDQTFDSATLVSVWQYVHHAPELMREFVRVLKPGSEVYIINKPGAHLDSVPCPQPTDPRMVERQVRAMGYDTLIETIPVDEPPFSAVVVAIPDRNGVSRIIDKERRIKDEASLSANPKDFLMYFSGWEAERARAVLVQLAEHPITQHSKEYVASADELTKESQERFGVTPVLFLEHDTPATLHLLTPNDNPFATLVLLHKDGTHRENEHEIYNHLRELMVPRKISGIHHMNYLGVESTPELWRKIDKLRDNDERGRCDNEWWSNEVNKLTSFIAAVPMSTATAELQKQVYEKLKKVPRLGKWEMWTTPLDKKIKQARNFNLYCAVSEYKQRRRIDKLVEAKKRIIEEGIPVAGTARLHFGHFLDFYRRELRESLSRQMRGWGMPSDD
jgi:hypothetical protein